MMTKLPILSVLVLGGLMLGGCGGDQENESEGKSKPAEPTTLDPATMVPQADGPKLVATSLATVIYYGPNADSEKMGYLRVGGTATRAQKPVSTVKCDGGWYAILPGGFVCVGKDASLDLEHPVSRALGKVPDLKKPLPYRYGFIRAVAPNYLRIPTKQEQLQYEFQLERHLRAYGKLKDRWNVRAVGANDVPLDDHGIPTGPPPTEPRQLSDNEMFGGSGNELVPWWLDGGRKIPHLASYRAPRYAVIAGRVKRHTGLALIGTFVPGDKARHRRMVITTDGRLVPASKLKPNVGSTWYGTVLSRKSRVSLPVGFITEREGAEVFELTDTDTNSAGQLPFRSTVNLTGTSRVRKGVKYVELTNDTWIRARDAAIAPLPSKLPSFARGNQKWIDLSIISQTMVAYEGRRAVYATMVSTGIDGLGDPKTTHSTIRGTFRIRDKHVTATMDADQVDNKFELRDVPWVQYFKGGYAMHAAYWHDDYGKPRSHGCVNMSPIDAHWFFFWTAPVLPVGWHAVYAGKKTGEGTLIHIHP